MTLRRHGKPSTPRTERASAVTVSLGILCILSIACASDQSCKETYTCPAPAKGGQAGNTPGGGASGEPAGGRASATGGKAEGGTGDSPSGGRSDSPPEESGAGGMVSSSGGAGSGASGRPGGNAGSGRGGQGGQGGEAGGDGGSGPSSPVCGNGKMEGDEACDDGADNGTTVLACAPDCSRRIEIKHIVIGEPLNDEDLQPDPVATADGTCPAGYKALFAYGTDRRATTVPFETSNPIDWVLRPWTYYYNTYENPIWLTHEVAFLGISEAAFTQLENYITTVTYVYVSNLDVGGMTLTKAEDNCWGWTFATANSTKRYGDAFATNGSYIFEPSTLPCGYQIAFYCVEQ